MKVCIDIQSAITQRAGVGRYTKSLVEHLGAFSSRHELTLFCFDFKRKGIPFEAKGTNLKTIQWCPGRVVQKMWKTMNWPPFNRFAGEADVYHFPNFIRLPLTTGKSVVTIHDVSFLRHPETTESKNLEYLTAQIQNTVEDADAIITDSQFSANEIAERLNVETAKLFPIHLGLTDPMTKPTPKHVEQIRNVFGLERPYLLTVGTLEPRKNIPFLIDVFEKIKGFEGDLVVAGMRGWKDEPILETMKTSSRSHSIRYLDYVHEEHLASLYAGATLFVFPSIYEGFGFPPLEAMQCGTPVLSSSAGSLPEVLGGAAVLMKSFDPTEWADKIEELLDDSSQRETLQAKGVQHIKKFTWAETAEKTWNVYASLIE
ncbi:MAG: glycosyltransferase [Kiritimatiellae bacterium]|nr:glycosyltransferase [Kiritimatiellia bacterium]